MRLKFVLRQLGVGKVQCIETDGLKHSMLWGSTEQGQNLSRDFVEFQFPQSGKRGIPWFGGVLV